MTLLKMIDKALDSGIRIEIAKSIEDVQKSAIHLFDPNSKEVETAIAQAISESHTLIVIHTTKTWPYKDVPWARKAVLGGGK